MKKPLEGIKVLDLTRFFAGPYCTMLLGDYGADVIKLEAPGGDSQREQGPPFVGDQAPGFMAVNRNKKGIVVNLRTEEGKKLAKALVEKVDVIVENFRPGVAEKLGLGFEEVSRINPNIIYCRISGYGSSGPEATNPAFDLTVQAYSGFMSMNGVPNGEPVKPAISIGDLMTGVYAFSGIQAALLRRERSEKKEAQLVETSLLECLTSYLTDAGVEYMLTGKERGALASHHANIAPYGAFKAKDGWLAIGAGHSHIWQRLCEELEMTELLTDPRFEDSKVRCENRPELIRILQERLSKGEVDYWVEKLLKAGIPSAPVNSIGRALDSEQSKAMGMIVNVEHPKLGNMRLLGPAIKQPGIDPQSWSAPPMIGEHTVDVLRDELGFLEKDIEELVSKNVVYSMEYSKAKEEK